MPSGARAARRRRPPVDRCDAPHLGRGRAPVHLGHTRRPAPPAWHRRTSVPGAGVITSFSHNANATAGSIRAVVVGPGSGPNDRTILGYSDLLTPVPSAPSTRSPCGSRSRSVPGSGCTSAPARLQSALRSTTRRAQDDPLTGSSTPSALHAGGPCNSRVSTCRPCGSRTSTATSTATSPRTSARSRSRPQAACPAPDTTITKAPAKKKSRSARRRSGSPRAPGATFTCAVDGKTAKPCASPFKRRYKYGKHVVVITAVSNVGIVDPTPAKVKFKIKRPGLTRARVALRCEARG